MANIIDCIPKDKSDLASVEGLTEFPYPAYKTILGDLFEWIKDMNWPVAQKIVPFLIVAGKDSIPHIKIVLSSNDATWEYWTLHSVVDKLPNNLITELKDDLRRISTEPTIDEVSEDVNILAKTLLKKCL